MFPKDVPLYFFREEISKCFGIDITPDFTRKDLEKLLTRERLPMWLWAELVPQYLEPKIPPDFVLDPKFTETESAAENKAVQSEPKKQKQTFYYAAIKTLHCVDEDLAFSEGLAKVYARILEDRGEKVYINQRLVLDAISSKNPNDGFILLVAMLAEYGHFLGNVLHGRAGNAKDASKLAGRDFAYLFMEYSEADLFNADFDFADFTAPYAKGEEQRFAVSVSGLSREQRINAFYTQGTANIWEGEA